MASHWQETDLPDAPGVDSVQDTEAPRSQHSEEPDIQQSRKRQRESEAGTRKRERVPWKLQLNVSVTSASPQRQLTEMRDAFLKNLAEGGGYDSYPFGNPEKRVH